MKKLLLLSALFISFLTFAQVPQGISYQAIALNGSGTPVVSSNVRVKLSILDSSASGTILYSETQLKTTNAQGLFNLVIGQGTLVSGAFNSINWGTNSKFLKVEMDATGGTTYATVGTTQLLSVPYALAADSLVTSAGEGITLVSPNGTPYQLTVDNSGNLSLPTSGSTGTTPSQLFLYGTFNSFNPSTSLLFNNTGEIFYGFKYLTSGSQLKFLADNNASATVYGLNASQDLAVGGSAYTVSSNGYYFIEVYHYDSNPMTFSTVAFAPVLYQNCTAINPTYNTGTNTFSFTVNGVTTSNNAFLFDFPSVSGSSSCGTYGDFLSDGSLEVFGTTISFPGVTTTPKNFRVDLIINFNGSANYTVTQI
ncbi:MAG TPA: hypothetical protein PKN96_01450 [Flavobacterium sp.]|uniref:hypothetical protein n=1 Tax=Flavobacterium sp. TaxID=239 RepID=UPI002B8AEB9E|nr:hypothetical protein [Flavobacterium sp.]HNP31938.1 hypothetical protein [Flavobacterium sp.]